jgi:dTDP-4-amino-4,6-dideoxygalactose transaminase
MRTLRCEAEIKIPFYRPAIDVDGASGAVLACLSSGWISNGPRVRDFEKGFAAFVGVSEAVAVSSCTGALHLALEALGIGAGDEVVVPDLTFVATAQAVILAGARPVLVDCKPDDLTIDPQAIEAAITPRTRAIVPMHYGGHPCDMDAIGEIARHRHLYIVEDAAHAFNASFRNMMIGASGALTCFSFHATKALTTGEGGMVTTPDSELASRIRQARSHGIGKDAWTRRSDSEPWEYDIEGPGHKYDMPDLLAAIGLVHLRCVHEEFARRLVLAERYRIALQNREDELSLLTVSPFVEHGWHLFTVLLNLEALGSTRAQIMHDLLERGITCAVHYRPLHMFPGFASLCKVAPGCGKTSEWAYERLISLPFYSTMRFDEVDRVVDTLIERIRYYRR